MSPDCWVFINSAKDRIGCIPATSTVGLHASLFGCLSVLTQCISPHIVEAVQQLRLSTERRFDGSQAPEDEFEVFNDREHSGKPLDERDHPKDWGDESFAITRHWEVLPDLKGFMAKPPIWDPKGVQWGSVAHWPLYVSVGSTRGRSEKRVRERKEKWRSKLHEPAFAATPVSGSGDTWWSGATWWAEGDVHAAAATPASGSGYKRDRDTRAGPAFAASSASSSSAAVLTSPQGDVATSNYARSFSLISTELRDRGGSDVSSDWASDGGRRRSRW